MLTTIFVCPKERQAADKDPHPKSNLEQQPVHSQPMMQPGYALIHTMSAVQPTPHMRMYTSSDQVSLYTCMGRDYKMLAITNPAYLTLNLHPMLPFHCCWHARVGTHVSGRGLAVF